MTRNPALSPLQDLEGPVCDVVRWGQVLSHLATSEHGVEGPELNVIATVLIALGQDLERKWKTAFESARGLA